MTARRPMFVYVNAGVTADVEIVSLPGSSSDESISIMFGAEKVALDFYDVESLERLRDIADQSARRLRAIIDANAQAREAYVKAAERPTALLTNVR